MQPFMWLMVLVGARGYPKSTLQHGHQFITALTHTHAHDSAALYVTLSMTSCDNLLQNSESKTIISHLGFYFLCIHIDTYSHGQNKKHTQVMVYNLFCKVPMTL